MSELYRAANRSTSSPQRNQCTRCCDDPCVGVSGAHSPGPGGNQPLLDVAVFLILAGLMLRLRPEHDQAVGLEPIAALHFVRCRLAQDMTSPFDLGEDAQLVLHVVPDSGGQPPPSSERQAGPSRALPKIRLLEHRSDNCVSRRQYHG